MVAVMPPDRESPEGGLFQAGLGPGGLAIGDTVGRTPGAFGFIVSCDLTGYVGRADTVFAGTLTLTRSGGSGMSPFSGGWKSSRGTGPAELVFEMARKFGSSPFLQASDYEAPADVPFAAAGFRSTDAAMTVTLSSAALALLAPGVGNQFRATLSVDTFSNFNGAAACACSLPPPHAHTHAHTHASGGLGGRELGCEPV